MKDKKNDLKFDKHFFSDVFKILFGALIFACGLYFFTAPNQLVPGGVSGLLIVMNYLFGFPIGLMSLLINIPLLILGLINLGKRFIVLTLISVVSFTVFYDYILIMFPQYTNDKLLACIFGGVLIGGGLGICFLTGGSTGGLDIVSKTIQTRFPHFQMGKIVFLLDFIVITIATITFKDITAAMYALIMMFVMSKVIDTVIYGLDTSKLILIITDKGDELCDAITQKVDRGITRLNSVGGYSNKNNSTLLCAVRPNEYYKLKLAVKEIDPYAFMIVTTSSEVIGMGFKNHD